MTNLVKLTVGLVLFLSFPATAQEIIMSGLSKEELANKKILMKVIQ